MRGLLIVNPNATTTTSRVREVLIAALAHQLRLEVARTDHRGHAADLATEARRGGFDYVIALGGDGTVNEVVNGLLQGRGPGPDTPVLGVVPAGNANVFARALGYPADPIEATGELMARLKSGARRTISLGLASGPELTGARYFTINTGLGIDAEIIAAMESARRAGHEATYSRYLLTTVRRLFATNRRHPQLAVHVPGEPLNRGVFVAFVQNTSPWTFLGALPVNPSPMASFDAGLDLWAARSLSLPASLSYARRMFSQKSSRSGSNVVARHDLTQLTIMCNVPTSLQIDGEGMGEVSRVEFRSVAAAIQVVA
ncbi:MAG: diacylglycerol kinase family protein [Candidatus Nanopelagicales bacterium]|nr:diacylglycerol kinase family protein [Candidatus Nanopelagicales bacterium]